MESTEPSPGQVEMTLKMDRDYWRKRAHEGEERHDQLEEEKALLILEIKRLTERNAVMEETFKKIALLLEEM